VLRVLFRQPVEIPTPRESRSLLNISSVLRLSHAVSNSGHWYLDLRDDTFFWSDEVFRILGSEPNSFKLDLETAISFIDPAEREHIQKSVRLTLDDHEPLDFTAAILCQDGTFKQIRIQGEMQQDEKDGFYFLFGILRETTDEWLQQGHNERLAVALENTSEAIIMTDLQGRATWINGAFNRITGYSWDDIIGHKPGDILQGPDTDPETVKYMRDMLSGGQHFTTEILNYHRDGHPYWLRISCQPDRDSQGKLVGFTAIESDVTTENEARLDLEREIESRKALEKQLRYLATHDELSGMPNRRYFIEVAEKELSRSKRYKHPLSLMLADFDHFKDVNDTHGHAAGDEVIQGFGELCRSILREQDMAARIGGEEFVIMLPETPLEGARELAKRLRHALSKMSVKAAGHEIVMTMSVGLTQAEPGESSIEVMMDRADKALYQSKDAGRNRTREHQDNS
jgi:diguanylate cyclase (GGDEF)-like protein/PAS domain S-box-containing protein